jgi:hypothetical protein
MNGYYYSQLDLINKYHLSNLHQSKNIIERVEVSLKKLEKEEIDGKNTDLEILNFFYSLLARSPKIVIKNIYDSGKLSREINKKVQIFNQKHILEVLNFTITQCYISEETLKVVNREKGSLSIVHEIELAYKKHSSHLPASLLRRSGNEIPTIKVEIFLKKNDIKNFMDLYPFWQLSDVIMINKTF